jgi:hypothetical protein
MHPEIVRPRAPPPSIRRSTTATPPALTRLQMVFLTDMDSVVPQKRPRESQSGDGPDHDPEPDQPGGPGEEKEHQRKRARLSCNICKARKTKESPFAVTGLASVPTNSMCM